jgi:capsular polysaccharide transport system permease protein
MNIPNIGTIKSFSQKQPIWFGAVLIIVLVSFYWALWASDKYVSKANVVLESPQIAAPTMDFSSLLTSGGNNNADMLLLRDYLLSTDLMAKVDQKVGFREHYSDTRHDIFSRLWSENVPAEDLHEYYLKQVSVELDEYSGVLRLQVQAYTPEIAQQILEFLLEEGEAHMNGLGQRLAEEQVRFLERQVIKQNELFTEARLELLAYQNDNGLISPLGTVESLNAVVANLEGQLANLKTKRKAILSYQSAKSPAVVKLDSEIDALNQQIAQEHARMAAESGGALNALSSEYQTLELKVQFAQESYAGALAALENTRIEAARKLKQVSILQSPTLPEYAIEPRRIHNIAVFSIMVLFAALIAQMLMVIIKDHRD